jgi:polyferredoxin
MDKKPLPVSLKVVSNDDGAMYAAHQKIYPREISGRFQRLRMAAVFLLLGIYYLFPWLKWDGRQIVLFDLPARKFYVFGMVFWPQDFFYLSALLIIAALSLFFFTALAGRLWCGYACPQTVWTEVFLWMERWVEGDRNARMKLDKGPWNARKIRLKAIKQFLWVSFALWTGFTFVGFFTPIRELADRFASFSLGGWELFWFLFYSLATYGNAGFLREQVCKYMCPYARFQSAMFDKDTLIISYDEARGEPRGARKKSVKSVAERRSSGEAGLGAGGWGAPTARHESPMPLQKRSAETRIAVTEELAPQPPAPSPEGTIRDSSSGVEGNNQPPASTLGDCIDCKACVIVCPVGIDIRDGLQYECIGCAACIDACDEVMDKMGYPRGLVRYSTEHALKGEPTRIIRKRTIFYALLLTAIVSALLLSIANRVPLIVDVIRDRGELYRESREGIENSYQLKLMNKTEQARSYRIEMLEPASVRYLGPVEVLVPAGAIQNVPMTLVAAPGALKGMVPVKLRVVALDDPTVERIEESRFYSP